MSAKTLVKWFALVVLASLIAAVAGCGAGYRTSSVNGHKKVYRVDEEGNKTLVYEVDKEGKTTIHDESDPQAQQIIAQQQRMQEMRAEEEARYERIRRAPKRRPGDPIIVALYETALGERLAEVEKPQGAVFKQIRREFESDAVITLLAQDELGSSDFAQFLAAMGHSRPPKSDVKVVTRGYLKQVAGIDRNTGKIGQMTAVVFEATITSNYLPAEHTVSESGSIFRNTEVTRKFAAKIKRVIKEEIGPTLPADRNI